MPDTYIRTVTKRLNQFSITIPVRVAQEMQLEDKEQLFIQFDPKTKTIYMNKQERVE